MNRRLNIGIVLGLASFSVDALVSTLVFPLLLKHLGRTEAGYWMLFSSLGALLGCLLTGLAPTTSRLIGGLHGRSNNGEAEPEAWAHARVSVTRVYRVAIMSGVAVGLMLVPTYLAGVAIASGRSLIYLALAWSAFLLGWAIRAVVQRNFSTLDGLGEVGVSRVVNTLGGLTNLVLLLCLLRLGIGVYAPVVAYLVVSGVIFWTSGWLLFRKAPAPWWGLVSARWRESLQLGKDAGSMFVLGITAYVVGQSCILFVERDAGVEAIATYAPVARVVSMLAAAACIPNAMLIPFLARAHGAHEREKFRSLSVMCMIASPLLYLVPGALLAVFPREVFGWWLGKENFVGESTSRLLLLYGLLSCVQNSLATPALAVRHRSFVREAVINMILVVMLMPMLASRFGLPGYPLGMIVGTLVPALMVCWQAVRFLRERPKS
jgi:O-antigen/teichoic acid export membrane protein